MVGQADQTFCSLNLVLLLLLEAASVDAHSNAADDATAHLWRLRLVCGNEKNGQLVRQMQWQQVQMTKLVGCAQKFTHLCVCYALKFAC